MELMHVAGRARQQAGSTEEEEGARLLENLRRVDGELTMHSPSGHTLSYRRSPETGRWLPQDMAKNVPSSLPQDDSD